MPWTILTMSCPRLHSAPEKVEIEAVWRFSIPNPEPLGRPIIAIDDVTFDYKPEGKSEAEYILQQVNFGVDLDSRIGILGECSQSRVSENGCFVGFCCFVYSLLSIMHKTFDSLIHNVVLSTLYRSKRSGKIHIVKFGNGQTKPHHRTRLTKWSSTNRDVHTALCG